MRFRVEIISEGHVYAGEDGMLNDALMAATECFCDQVPHEDQRRKDLAVELIMLQQIAKSLPDDHFGELPPEMMAEIKGALGI